MNEEIKLSDKEKKSMIMDAAINMYEGDDYLIDKFLEEYGYYDDSTTAYKIDC